MGLIKKWKDPEECSLCSLEEDVNHILFNRTCQFSLNEHRSGSAQGQGPQTTLGTSLDTGLWGVTGQIKGGDLIFFNSSLGDLECA